MLADIKFRLNIMDLWDTVEDPVFSIYSADAVAKSVKIKTMLRFRVWL
jgi:hypothetical protein